MSTNYYIMMDNQVFGPYSYNEVVDLGILSDTMICTDDADSMWQEARNYSEFRNLFIFNQTEPQNIDPINYVGDNSDIEDDVEEIDETSDFENDDYVEPNGENMQRLLFYKQKRKAALIGFLTLGLAGLAVVGVRNTWRSNIFSGTSFDKGGMGFIFKIISFMILSVIVAIPFFIISLIELIYYSVKIKKLQ